MKGDELLLEKRISSKLLHKGVIFDLYGDEVTLPNGNTSKREYVKANGAVAIVALTESGEVIMERQFRYPHDSVIWEIPAGKLDSPDEDKLEAAKRELREETGITAQSYVSLGDYVPSAAILSEVIRVYLATGLSFGGTDLDEDEFINVTRLPLDRVVEMILSNEIGDGKTAFGVLKAKLMIEKGDIPNVRI